MNLAAWIVSGLLAAMYLYGGLLKSVRPIEKLRPMMGWVDDMPVARVRFIGIVELAGALGLILPKLAGVVDDRHGVDGTLTGLAAVGLFVIQALAIPVHARRGELKDLPLNVVLALMAAFVAAARFGWL